VTDEPAADLPAGDDPDAAALQIVCFQIGDQRYGLDIMRVKEVAFAAPVIAVPGAPAFVAGIVEVHGVYVPLVDLRRRFGVASGAAGRLLLVALDGLIIALAVDRVIDTRPVDPRGGRGATAAGRHRPRRRRARHRRPGHPAARSGRHPRSRRAPPASRPGGRGVTRPRVLIAHEEAAIRDSAMAVARDAGYQVVGVADGASARVLLLETRPVPAALVVDVALPGVLGYELCADIAAARMPTAVILIASVYSRTAYKRRPQSLARRPRLRRAAPRGRSAGRQAGPPGARGVGGGRPAPTRASARPRPSASAGEGRLAFDYGDRTEGVERAMRLARLIAADLALYCADDLRAWSGAGPGAAMPPALARDVAEGQRLFDAPGTGRDRRRARLPGRGPGRPGSNATTRDRDSIEAWPTRVIVRRDTGSSSRRRSSSSPSSRRGPSSPGTSCARTSACATASSSSRISFAPAAVRRPRRPAAPDRSRPGRALRRDRAREQRPGQPVRGPEPAARLAALRSGRRGHPRGPAQLRRRPRLHPDRAHRRRRAHHRRPRPGRRLGARAPGGARRPRAGQRAGSPAFDGRRPRRWSATRCTPTARSTAPSSSSRSCPRKTPSKTSITACSTSSPTAADWPCKPRAAYEATKAR
jgi:CheY-like chemotaxis protein